MTQAPQVPALPREPDQPDVHEQHPRPPRAPEPQARHRPRGIPVARNRGGAAGGRDGGAAAKHHVGGPDGQGGREGRAKGGKPPPQCHRPAGGIGVGGFIILHLVRNRAAVNPWYCFLICIQIPQVMRRAGFVLSAHLAYGCSCCNRLESAPSGRRTGEASSSRRRKRPRPQQLPPGESFPHSNPSEVSRHPLVHQIFANTYVARSSLFSKIMSDLLEHPRFCFCFWILILFESRHRPFSRFCSPWLT